MPKTIALESTVNQPVAWLVFEVPLLHLLVIAPKSNRWTILDIWMFASTILAFVNLGNVNSWSWCKLALGTTLHRPPLEGTNLFVAFTLYQRARLVRRLVVLCCIIHKRVDLVGFALALFSHAIAPVVYDVLTILDGRRRRPM